MRVLDWLRGLFRSRWPEEDVRVVVNDEDVRCTQLNGQVDAISWSVLQVVGVETNCCGPFIEDVYFYLEGPEYGFYVPQSAHGTDELVRRLTELPGFDGDAFADAMCSTSDARFICWRRSEHDPMGTCGDDGKLL